MRIARVSRRRFLVVSGLAGSGLILGVCSPKQRRQARSHGINAFVEIGEDDITTIYLPRSEMGQGVSTALPMLVAEELEANWNKVRVRQADLDPKYGSQNTSSSASVHDSWKPLREAGAVARTMLIAAAARRWNVPAPECSAREGIVRHGPSGVHSTFGELAADAATLPVPKDVRLKDPRAFRIIGRAMPRPDGAEIVSGKTIYGIDVMRDGMLFASVQRCPIFGGRIARVDDRAARAVPGVRDIVRIPPDHASRQFWDGAAVVADSTWAALKGREALVVEYERPASVESSDEYTRRLRESFQGEGVVAKREGDVEQAFAKAVRTIDAEYEVPFQAHATMEPPACVVDVRANDVEVWAPTQTPERVAMFISSYLRVPQERIRVHVTALGGGFGRKTYNDYVLEAAYLSKRVGAPVRLMMTREDDLRHGLYRPAQLHRLRAALDSAGSLIAWHHQIAGASVSAFVRADWRVGYPFEESGGAFDIPYRIPNMLTEFHRVDSSVPRGVWRSVSTSSTNFAVQGFLDEVAFAAGKDPVAFRRELIGEPRRIPYPPPDDQFYVDSGRALQVLDVAAGKSGWGSSLPAGRARGVALLDGGGPAVAQVAEVSLTGGSMKVERVVCAIECGLVVNPDGVRAQVEGGIAFGLSAMQTAITTRDGAVEQSNFHDYPILTMQNMPRVEVHIVPSDREPEGAGEPPVPPIAPAVANALFALTGKRVRKLPLRLET